MFRRIIVLNTFWARNIKRKHSNQPQISLNDVQDQNTLHTINTEYQKVKQIFRKLDQKDHKNPSSVQSDQFSFEQFKKMLQQSQKDDKQQSKMKKKPSVVSKLRSMNTPQQLLRKQNRADQGKQTQYVKNGDKEREDIKLQMREKDNNNEQQRQLINQILKNNNISEEQMKKINKNQLKMAQQQLLLDEIMKQSKEKQLKIGRKSKKGSENLQITDEEKKLILRRQKIMQALQKNQDPSQLKYNITKEDLLKMKYSSEILEKAKQYKNYQLGYLKELIINQDQQTDLSSIHHRKLINQSASIKQNHQQNFSRQIESSNSIQNSYKTLKGEQGLTLYEDDKFYKDKVVNQMKQRYRLTEQDIQLKKQLQKDLDEGNQTSNIFLDEVVFPFDAQLERKIQYRQTSFGQQQKRIKIIQQKFQTLGIQFSPQQIKNISKQALFQQKHFLQQQQAFQKYLHKKQKKKNMKKQLKQIHMNVLKDNVDFDKETQPSMTMKQIKESSNIQMLEENLQRLQEYDTRKQSVLVTETPDQKQSKIHYIKTFRNMQNFIAMYFAQGTFNHNIGQLDDIQILKIIPNRTNTVLNIFWSIEPKYLQQKSILIGNNSYDELFKKQKIKLEARLKKQSKYISSKMTQCLKLRYGPDIRFFYDLKTEKTVETIQQLGKHIKEIAMDQVQQYRKKGLIKNQKEQIQYFTKLLDIAKSNLHQFNNRKHILSKKYQKMNAQEPKIQNNTKDLNPKRVKKNKSPILQQQVEKKQNNAARNISRKKKPSDKLWDTIQLL